MKLLEELLFRVVLHGADDSQDALRFAGDRWAVVLNAVGRKTKKLSRNAIVCHRGQNAM